MTHEAAPSRGLPSSAVQSPSVYSVSFPPLVGRTTHLLNMLHARRPDQDSVPVLPLHQAVVRHPPQRDLSERQVMLLRDDLD